MGKHKVMNVMYTFLMKGSPELRIAVVEFVLSNEEVIEKTDLRTLIEPILIMLIAKKPGER